MFEKIQYHVLDFLQNCTFGPDHVYGLFGKDRGWTKIPFWNQVQHDTESLQTLFWAETWNLRVQAKTAVTDLLYVETKIPK